MTSIEGIGIAGLVHLIFGLTVFINPDSRFETPGSPVASVFVCLAILDVTLAHRIVPKSLDEKPRAVKIFCESLVVLFIVEVGMLVFWQTCEHITYMCAKTILLQTLRVEALYYYENESLLVSYFTVPLSLSILSFTLIKTKSFEMLGEYYSTREVQDESQFADKLEFLESLAPYSDRIFREALIKYKLIDQDKAEWEKLLRSNKRRRKT